MKRKKIRRRNALFNNSLNIIDYSYAGIRDMVKYYTECEIGNFAAKPPWATLFY